MTERRMMTRRQFDIVCDLLWENRSETDWLTCENGLVDFVVRMLEQYGIEQRLVDEVIAALQHHASTLKEED